MKNARIYIYTYILRQKTQDKRQIIIPKNSMQMRNLVSEPGKAFKALHPNPCTLHLGRSCAGQGHARPVLRVESQRSESSFQLL